MELFEVKMKFVAVKQAVFFLYKIIASKIIKVSYICFSYDA